MARRHKPTAARRQAQISGQFSRSSEWLYHLSWPRHRLPRLPSVGLSVAQSAHARNRAPIRQTHLLTHSHELSSSCSGASPRRMGAPAPTRKTRPAHVGSRIWVRRGPITQIKATMSHQSVPSLHRGTWHLASGTRRPNPAHQPSLPAGPRTFNHPRENARIIWVRLAAPFPDSEGPQTTGKSSEVGLIWPNSFSSM